MSTISMFGTCQTCNLVQYMQGQPCRDCGGKVKQGGQRSVPMCSTPTGARCPGDGVNGCKKCPVPPAGGEPEVVGWRDKEGRCVTHGGTGRYSDPFIRLEDHRAHVTRLHAEAKTALEACDAYGVQVVELRAEVERLKQVAIDRKDELTKAREALQEIANTSVCGIDGTPSARLQALGMRDVAASTMAGKKVWFLGREWPGDDKGNV